MNQSESIKELAAALCKAQGQILPAVKDSTNPHFRSKYADLASVWDACRKPLTDNGLSIVQLTGGGPDTVTITTRLMHSSGEWVESELTLKPLPATPQGIGSAVTYGRRYSLMAMVGVAPDDEDDGNAASSSPPKPVQAAPDPKKEEAKRLGLVLTRMINDRKLTVDEVRAIGNIPSINEAMQSGNVEALKKALHDCEVEIIRRKEIAEAG